MRKRTVVLAALLASIGVAAAIAQSRPEALKGSAAFGDWRGDKPGVRRHITPKDLPRPHASPSARNSSRVVKRPAGATPRVPPGFKAEIFAEGLKGPRVIQVAPNGDVFVAETRGGQIRVLRAAEGAARPTAMEVFATGLIRPFGIAFYPRGDAPEWVYVATAEQVVRFPYRAADLTARDKPEGAIA